MTSHRAASVVPLRTAALALERSQPAEPPSHESAGEPLPVSAAAFLWASWPQAAPSISANGSQRKGKEVLGPSDLFLTLSLLWQRTGL